MELPFEVKYKIQKDWERKKKFSFSYLIAFFFVNENSVRINEFSQCIEVVDFFCSQLNFVAEIQRMNVIGNCLLQFFPERYEQDLVRSIKHKIKIKVLATSYAWNSQGDPNHKQWHRVYSHPIRLQHASTFWGCIQR
jgi:hypothetical protein